MHVILGSVGGLTVWKPLRPAHSRLELYSAMNNSVGLNQAFHYNQPVSIILYFWSPVVVATPTSSKVTKSRDPASVCVDAIIGLVNDNVENVVRKIKMLSSILVLQIPSLPIHAAKIASDATKRGHGLGHRTLSQLGTQRYKEKWAWKWTKLSRYICRPVTWHHSGRHQFKCAAHLPVFLLSSSLSPRLLLSRDRSCFHRPLKLFETYLCAAIKLQLQKNPFPFTRPRQSTFHTRNLSLSPQGLR